MVSYPAVTTPKCHSRAVSARRLTGKRGDGQYSSVTITGLLPIRLVRMAVSSG
jgi:hypothetical protein